MATYTSDPTRKTAGLGAEIFITIIGIFGIILGLTLAEKTFSSAAIDFKLSRQEVIQQATNELIEMGYDPTGYQFALIFQQDYFGSIYTERMLGVAETNRLLKNENIPLYHWSARWFRPLQKEEFRIDLSPQGELVSFIHIISEDDPGADLPEAEARQTAEAYIQQLGWQLDQLKLLSASNDLRPSGRRDHTFTWERSDLKIGEGELRIETYVLGDKLGGYQYYLDTPDAFSREYSIQRNRAGFINELASFVTVAGLGSAVVVAFGLAILRRRINPLRHIWPWILLVTIIGLLSELNFLPLAKINYGTTQDYALFWVYRLLNLPILSITTFAFLAIIWGGANQISKLVWPMQDRVLPRGANRWVEFSRSAWRGIMLSGWMIGYLMIFYYVANNLLGWWSPMDTPPVNLFATPFPFFGALEIGLYAGTWEELLFRLVGISLVLWITRGRYTWLALLLPGLIWAAGHADYIADPIYARVVELTIAAVFIEGLFFLRFGLLTTIIAHTTYNAMLMALPMLASSEPYFIANGVAVMIFLGLPLLPGLIITLQRKRRKENAPGSTEIGPASATDLPGLIALPAQNFPWETLLADPNSIIVCARQAQQIVGMAIGQMYDDGRAEIKYVFVKKAWRNQFLGSKLVETLQQLLQSRQVVNILVTLPVKEKRGTSFFASLGWQPATQTFVPQPLSTFGQATRSLWDEIRHALKRQE